jgi:hypothetical protein
MTGPGTPEFSGKVHMHRGIVEQGLGRVSGYRRAEKELRALGGLASEARNGIASGLGIHLTVPELYILADVTSDRGAFARYTGAESRADELADTNKRLAVATSANIKDSKAWLVENGQPVDKSLEDEYKKTAADGWLAREIETGTQARDLRGLGKFLRVARSKAELDEVITPEDLLSTFEVKDLETLLARLESIAGTIERSADDARTSVDIAHQERMRLEKELGRPFSEPRLT